jgi:hypothetical protein
MRRNAKPSNEAEAQDRDRARAALAQMRRKPKLSLRAAANAEGTTTKSMLRYVGSAIRLEHGRYRATPYDRSPRPMNFYSDTDDQGQPHGIRYRRLCCRLPQVSRR